MGDGLDRVVVPAALDGLGLLVFEEPGVVACLSGSALRH